MKKVIVTKDNFVWVDVTEQMKYGQKKREELWLSHELYVLQDDDSESLVKSHDDIDDALHFGLRIVIEGGYLPSDIIKQLAERDEIIKELKELAEEFKWSPNPHYQIVSEGIEVSINAIKIRTL